MREREERKLDVGGVVRETTVARKNCNYMSLCSKDIDYQRVSTFFWTPLYFSNLEAEIMADVNCSS
jgi:hypothetical protein